MTLDPTTLAWSGYWRASYGSTPWAATSSAGVSGTTGNLVSTPPFDPTSGAPQNSLTPANFASQYFTNATLDTSLFTSTAGSILAVFAASGILSVATGNVYDDAVLIRNNNSNWGASITLSGLTAYAYDGAYKSVTSSVPTDGLYHVARIRWNGSTIGLTVDNGAESTTACGSVIFGGDSIEVGIGYISTKYFLGQMLEIGTFGLVVSDATYLAYGQYAQERYLLNKGFPYPILPAVYTDRVDRRQLERSRFASARQQAYSGPASPPAPLAVLQPNHRPGPDRIDRRQINVRQHVSLLPGITSLSPSPIPTDTTAFAQMRGYMPERVLRPMFKGYQQDAFEGSPLPIPRDTTTFAQMRATYPDRPARVTYLTAAQDAFELPPLQSAAPAYTPINLASYPDALARRRPSPGDSGGTVPFQNIPTALSAYPDAMARPKFGAWLQMHLAALPMRERTSPLADPEFPDRVPRPRMAAAMHRFHASPVAPVPVLGVQAQWPDVVRRPTVKAYQQRLPSFWPYPIPAVVPVVVPVPVITVDGVEVVLLSARGAQVSVLSAQSAAVTLLTARGVKVVVLDHQSGEISLLSQRTRTIP